MHIAEAIPSDWNHGNCRVQLHSARSERNHCISESNIFVGESLNISHHISLRELHSEDVLVHILVSSLQMVTDRHIFATFIILESGVVTLSGALFEGSKDVDDLVKIVNSCQLIERNSYVVIVDLSQVYTMLVELSEDEIG